MIQIKPKLLVRSGELGTLQLRGAVAAAGGLDRDLHLAEGAVLDRRRGRRRRLLLPLQAVDRPDQKEDREGHDDEVDHRVDEDADVERGRTGLLGRSQVRIVAAGQGDEEIGEVDAAQQDADRRHDDVVHQGLHDSAEGRADDDTHGHVDDIAAHRELFELLEHVTFDPRTTSCSVGARS